MESIIKKRIKNKRPVFKKDDLADCFLQAIYYALKQFGGG